MALLIPSLGFARFDSRGELRLAERLKDFLEENAVVWHNLPVGPHSRHLKQEAPEDGGPKFARGQEISNGQQR